MLATTTAAPSWKQLLRYVIPAASAMVLFSLYACGSFCSRKQ